MSSREKIHRPHWAEKALSRAGEFEGHTDPLTAMAECFAEHGEISDVRRAFTDFEGKLFDELELAVQVFIAIGEERGQGLERAFPQYAGANPANHDWAKNLPDYSR
jgi:hypothetical protein